MVIEESFGIVTDSNRMVIAILHDNMYKPWSYKILKFFSDDIEIDDIEDNNEKSNNKNKKNKISLHGPLNQIAPIIIKNMFYDIKQNQLNYLPHLQKLIIMPYRLNLVHFFAYTNNSICLQSAFQLGIKY